MIESLANQYPDTLGQACPIVPSRSTVAVSEERAKILGQRFELVTGLKDADGRPLNYTGEDIVNRIVLLHNEVKRSGGMHVANMMQFGWFLLQIRNRFRYGTWHDLLQGIGINIKTAQRCMTIAREFADSEGAPDPVKLQLVGVSVRAGGVLENLSADFLLGRVRAAKAERRQRMGIKQPGKTDDTDELLSGDIYDHFLGEGEDEEEQSSPPSAPLDPDERERRVALLRNGLTRAPRTDNETDMIPDSVGMGEATTLVARVGEVPSAGDSGTHAPVQNPSVASDVGGSFRTSGSGETERTMTQVSAASRGASGEQFTFEQHRERLRNEVRQLVSQLEDLLACAERGEVSMESAYSQICILRGEAVRVRRDAA